MPLARGVRSLVPAALLAIAACGLPACGEHAKLPFMAGVGPDPVLPPPNPTTHRYRQSPRAAPLGRCGGLTCVGAGPRATSEGARRPLAVHPGGSHLGAARC